MEYEVIMVKTAHKLYQQHGPLSRRKLGRDMSQLPTELRQPDCLIFEGRVQR